MSPPKVSHLLSLALEPKFTKAIWPPKLRVPNHLAKAIKVLPRAIYIKIGPKISCMDNVSIRFELTVQNSQSTQGN